MNYWEQSFGTNHLSYLACEEALHFAWRTKRVRRERTSKRQSREGPFASFCVWFGANDGSYYRPNHDEELVCRLLGAWKEPDLILSTVHLYAVALFYPWFKFYFPLFRGMVMYDIKFERKGNKIWTKDKIEPQHIHKNRVAVKEFPKVIYRPFLLNPWLYRHLRGKLSFYSSLKETPGLKKCRCYLLWMYLTGITYHLFLYSVDLLLPRTGEGIGCICVSNGRVSFSSSDHSVTNVGISTPRWRLPNIICSVLATGLCE